MLYKFSSQIERIKHNKEALSFFFFQFVPPFCLFFLTNVLFSPCRQLLLYVLISALFDRILFIAGILC